MIVPVSNLRAAPRGDAFCAGRSVSGTTNVNTREFASRRTASFFDELAGQWEFRWT